MTQRDDPWVNDSWVFADGVPSDVYVMYSDDRGERWSVPTRVNDNQRQVLHEEPVLAVNDDGVVGVAWYDRRHASGEDWPQLVRPQMAQGLILGCWYRTDGHTKFVGKACRSLNFPMNSS